MPVDANLSARDAGKSEAELVLACDAAGRVVGVVEKMRAHRERILHKAVSVFLFVRGGALLMQQRAQSKYHSGGLWTNSACTHPRPGETSLEAARRASSVELGITAELTPVCTAIYDVDVGSRMFERERSDIFIGVAPPPPWRFSAVEVSAVELVEPLELERLVDQEPGRLTSWFRHLHANHWRELMAAFAVL
jgi:isopentenyl-diphosphate delta-isomerase